MKPTNRLKFNAKSHDKKIEQRQKAELDAQQGVKRQKAMRDCYKFYTQWKRKLISLAKAKGAISTDFVAAEVVRLQFAIEELCKTAGVNDWKDFTVTMLADKEKLLIALGITRNRATRFTGELQPDPNATPVTGDFETQAELESLPWIQNALKVRGAVGLIRQGYHLMVLHDDGIFIPVAVVVNMIGVQRLPTVAEIQAQLPKDNSEN